jgi:hypothetical protein
VSIKATDRAWESDASGNDLLVLLALADKAGGHDDDYDHAYPSVATIEKMTRLSRRTVQRCLRSLEEAGHIRQTGEHVWSRSKITTQYRIEVARQSDAGASDEAEGGVSADAGGASRVTPKPSSEPSQDPPGGLTPSASAREIEDQIFAYWQEKCGHPTAKFIDKRRRAVRARLREGYTPREICEGIRGAALRPTVGDNGVVYDDLELICRDGTKLENFRQRAGLPPNVTPIGRGRATVTQETFAVLDAAVADGRLQ